MAIKRFGSNVLRQGPTSKIPGGRHPLPSPLADITVTDHESVTTGRALGLMYLPISGEYTFMLRVFGQGTAGVDAHDIDSRVDTFSGLLTELGRMGHVTAMSIITDTVPETGKNVANEINYIMDKDHGHPISQKIQAELAYATSGVKVRLEQRVSFTFSPATPEAKKSPDRHAGEVRRHLGKLIAFLTGCGLHVREMSRADIAGYVRRCFDPSAQIPLEDALYNIAAQQPQFTDLASDMPLEQAIYGAGLRQTPLAGTGPNIEVSWDDVGPHTARAFYDFYRHDGTDSVTWESAGDVRGSIHAEILKALLNPYPLVPRKRVCQTFYPLNPVQAQEVIDRDLNRTGNRRNTARKQTDITKGQLQYQAAQEAITADALGHGQSSMTVMVTASVPKGSDIPAVESVITTLSTQSRLQVRRCYGYQQDAFLAGMGIGYLTSQHATMPKQLREV